MDGVDGVVGVVTPVNGERCQQVGNKSVGGGVGGCRWWSQFPVVVRIPYDGFLLGFGVMTPETG